MITVEKIGGTSMSQFGDVLKNIMLKDRDRTLGRVYVVSAYAGVTNDLLEHKKTGAPGVYAKFAGGGDWAGALDALLGKLKGLNAGFAGVGLDVPKADTFLEKRFRELKGQLASLRHVLGGGYVRKESVLLAAREMLASIGEAHSAFNAVEILKAKGVERAYLLDLTGSDDDDPITIDERIHQSLRGLDVPNLLVVATGYVKGVDGLMREFDRGYSEITFSKIAVELRPDEAIIHKEFHLSSADPVIVGPENTVVVGQTSYDVADQLADVGMEAIHPRAAKPLEMAGIPLRLKNTFEPDHPGTLITKDFVGTKARVEVIAGTKKVTIVDVHDPLMVGTVGFDREMMGIFEKHGVSYILKCTSANSITHVVWEADAKPALIEELRAKYWMIETAPAAVVGAIGTNISIPGVLARAARGLAESGINVTCISQSFRQTNMQFVIDRADYEKAIVALNKALCL